MTSPSRRRPRCPPPEAGAFAPGVSLSTATVLAESFEVPTGVPRFVLAGPGSEGIVEILVGYAAHDFTLSCIRFG